MVDIIVPEQKIKCFSQNLKKEKEIIDYLRLISFLSKTETAIFFYIAGFQEHGKRCFPKYETIAQSKSVLCSLITVKRSVSLLQNTYGILGENPRCRKSKELFIKRIDEWVSLIPAIRAKMEATKRPTPLMALFLKQNENVAKNSDITFVEQQRIVKVKKNHKKRPPIEVSFSALNVEVSDPPSAQNDTSPSAQNDTSNIDSVFLSINTKTSSSRARGLDDLLKGEDRDMDKGLTKVTSLGFEPKDIRQAIAQGGSEVFQRVLARFGDSEEVDIPAIVYAYVFAYRHQERFQGQHYRFHPLFDGTSMAHIKSEGLPLKTFDRLCQTFFQLHYGIFKGDRHHLGLFINNLSKIENHVLHKAPVSRQRAIEQGNAQQDLMRDYDGYWKRIVDRYRPYQKNQIPEHLIGPLSLKFFEHNGIAVPPRNYPELMSLFDEKGRRLPNAPSIVRFKPQEASLSIEAIRMHTPAVSSGPVALKIVPKVEERVVEEKMPSALHDMSPEERQKVIAEAKRAMFRRGPHVR